MAIAVQVAGALNHPLLNRYRGAYVLGSTTPDIRVITLLPREFTHFSKLDTVGITTGVEVMLEKHPELDPEKVTPQTAAFIAGYSTHLIADQSWITNVYRPFFGNEKVYEDNAVANVLDRALQLELDRQNWAIAQETLPALHGAEQDITVPFIDQYALEAWREWVQRYLYREFTWTRLRMLAGRRQHETHLDRAHEAAEEFLLNSEKGLEHIRQKVTIANMEDYREQTMTHCIAVIKGYLKCE